MNPTGQPSFPRLAPRPTQVPMPPPRPDSPGTAHLKAMCQDPHGAIAAGLLPRYPTGSYEMPPATAEAARQFREFLFAADPTGYFRHTGEFGQSFRLQNGQVVPNDPIRYESGNSVGGGPMHPGTFTNIHSHNYAPPPTDNAFPSPNDHLAARETAHSMGQAHELMYHPASDRFFAYSGAVPPVFFEARFPGQPPANPNSPAHSNCVVSGPPPYLLPAHTPLPAPYLPPTF